MFLAFCSSVFTSLVFCSKVSNYHGAQTQVKRRMWAVLLHYMRMSPACAQLRGCTVYSAFAALFTVLICYSCRITALRELRFGGTVLLAPHDSTASKAGSDLTAASSCEDCGVMFRWG